MSFQLHAPYQPAGDQPAAIAQLVEGLHRGEKHQTLLGVTGSGKTFTMANVIQQVQRPTLVLTHNKTLVAQLFTGYRSIAQRKKRHCSRSKRELYLWYGESFRI